VFHSFFPRPKLFAISGVVWAIVTILAWYFVFDGVGASLGYVIAGARTLRPFIFPGAGQSLVLRVSGGLPWAFRRCLDRACQGSSLETLVDLGFAADHRGDLFRGAGFGGDQQLAATVRRPAAECALSKQPGITAWNFYDLQIVFAQIVFLSMAVSILTDFFTNHYIFRWRTAMNDFYMSKWEKLRHIEGASQRVQEDTMRFSATLEGLGINLINAVMTLVVFLPILFALSGYVSELPLIGEVPHALFWLAIFWSAFGTILLATVGVKLPGLNFRNQRVEAAYRKELVYGEDHADRAQPATIRELYSNVRKNYFRMYFHYLYFNVARYFYIQADAVFLLLMLVPTIVAGKITYGIYQQIATAFGQVSNSVSISWSAILVDDHRTALHPQAPQGLRSGHRRPAAADHRPALPGAGSRSRRTGGR
jgi:peptide/bleomycin uptake transporter